jgi:hypothetical protein
VAVYGAAKIASSQSQLWQNGLAAWHFVKRRLYSLNGTHWLSKAMLMHSSA